MRTKVVMPVLRATKALTPLPVAKPRRTTPMEGLGRRARARRTLAALTSVAFVTAVLVAGTAGPAAAIAVPGTSRVALSRRRGGSHTPTRWSIWGRSAARTASRTSPAVR